MLFVHLVYNWLIVYFIALLDCFHEIDILYEFEVIFRYVTAARYATFAYIAFLLFAFSVGNFGLRNHCLRLS